MPDHILRYPGQTSIGRARTNKIQPESGSVSKLHAIINVEGPPEGPFTEAWIQDLQTRNGTFVGVPSKWKVVNGKTPLKIGDYIKFGESTVLYIFDEIDNPPPVSPGPLQDGSLSLSKSGGQLPELAGSQAAGVGENMSISINYPSGIMSSRQAVTIQIDPKPLDSSEQGMRERMLQPPKVSASVSSPEKSLLKDPAKSSLAGSRALDQSFNYKSADTTAGGRPASAVNQGSVYGSNDSLAGAPATCACTVYVPMICV